jgi:hypothetical protein
VLGNLKISNVAEIPGRSATSIVEMLETEIGNDEVDVPT